MAKTGYKILIICGSRRAGSLTRKLTDVAFGHAKRKYKDVHYLDLSKTNVENFRGFEERYDKTTTDTVKLIESADVFIIASPVYNALLSFGLKNIFEFINYKALEGRAAGFILKGGTPGSLQQVRGHLVAMMNYFNVVSNPRSVFATDDDFDGQENLKNKEIKNRIIDLVESTIKLKKVA